MAFASKEDSRIRMVALTINGMDNIVWYSPIRGNKKSDDVIINGMLYRFQARPEIKYVNKIQFYNNIGNNELIREYQIR
ncbi:hypothetical protein [Flavobacterium cerinum]|uniref:Uncharacterized protein n=1 Tax=Flavobacterium cerinum TaxID=2502784 RepID=A0ABY5ITS0_9FLAO|nr:hypothetical protein [Flavobacterium cerinum]UUC45562.1 hypothetical protein NOX80_18320 [Flavobacterium cerinum]